MSIHKNYLLLTPEEKEFVDESFREMFRLASGAFNQEHIPLDGLDPAERAVEAVATWVIESRRVKNEAEKIGEAYNKGYAAGLADTQANITFPRQRTAWIPEDGESSYDPKTEE